LLFVAKLWRIAVKDQSIGMDAGTFDNQVKIIGIVILVQNELL
jgi:hypothetical protein